MATLAIITLANYQLTR